MSVTSRRGVMVTEIYTGFAVAAVLVSLLLPAIQQARAAARRAQCMNNLRQFAIGMYSFAESDERGRFCTGASNYLTDGSPDTYGWTADFVNIGAGFPSVMLCAANTTTHSQFIEQLMQAEASTQHQLPDDLAGRFKEGKAADLLSTATLSKERADYVTSNFIDHGYDTNYTPSWFLVRGHINEVKLKEPPADTQSLKSIFSPLTMNDLENASAASSAIPFMADGRGYRSENVVTGGTIFVGQATGRAKRELMVKENTTKTSLFVPSMTGGTVFWDPTVSQILNPAGENIHGVKPEKVNVPRLTFKGDQVPHGNHMIYVQRDAKSLCEYYGGEDQRYWLQDTRQWQPVHNNAVMVMMADGSVHAVADTNSDGYLNPGFPASPEHAAKNGYAQKSIDFAGPFLYSGPMVKMSEYPEF